MSAIAFDAIPTAVADALRAWPALADLVGTRVYVNRSQTLPAQRVNGINVRVEQAESLQPLMGGGALEGGADCLLDGASFPGHAVC